MKLMSSPRSEHPVLLAFGAHPDDIEFGCGGVIARETGLGRKVHYVICSRGEAGTRGTPEQRSAEAERAAAMLGAKVEFVDFDGDSHLDVKAAHAIRIAGLLRRHMPGLVLAPSCVENQHPDHWRLGKLVRDAARLARYGGLSELREWRPHAISQLFYYAVTAEAEPRDISPILVDVSDADLIAKWIAAMEAHASQTGARNYVELQLTRARLWGARAGIGHAVPLFPNDPVIVGSLMEVERAARKF